MIAQRAQPDTKTAHTPGPWRLITDGTKPGVAGEIVTDETTIASVNMWEQATRPGEPFANARLMVAAPDMLAALDRIFSYVSYVNIHGVGHQPEPNGEPQPVRVSPEEFGQIFQEIGKLSSVAIAKAEGRS